MVKLGKVFSIILVFALLIVLAPALVPRAASADPGPGDLPNPMTVTFDADVDYIGTARSFTAVPNTGVEGNDSMGIQFTRDPVIYNNTLNDCKFYNISAASGPIAGDLSGSIDLEWNRLDLNMTYPYTPKYVATPDGFGLLYIKGNLSTSELGDFKFIAAADLDYKDTTTKGAGRICTVIPWVSPPVNGSLEEVLIGEITDYTLTSSKISGTLSLRYYNKTDGEIESDWNYMYLAGVLGGDRPDNITARPETVTMVQFTRANLVPTWSNKTVAMEESHPGRETPQRLIAGYIGTNGTITLRRTGIYAYVHVGPPGDEGMDLPAQSVHLIKNTLDNWVCNDTQYRGMSHSIVGVDMVNFDEFGVDQQSYSWMPGYSPGYEGEGYLKGFEAFSISSTHITLLSEVYGTYYEVRLSPTPVIDSVSPNVGQGGDTFNVTINGKWFLVDPAYHPLNVTFSDPNVTVNSHQMIDDTQINVNITIAGGAGVGASNVSVTKLGVTGTMTDGFGVGSAVDGEVTFPGRGGGNIWIEPFDVTVFDAGTNNVSWAGTSTTNVSGVFTVTGLTPGTYDIRIKNATCLSEKVTNVVLTLGNSTVVDFGETREGDMDGNNVVNMMDRDLLYMGWGSQNVVQAGYYCDLDRNTWLNMMDRDLMYMVWGQSGA